MKTTLAERLKESRNRAGLSQKALGDAVGVSQAAIQKLESGIAKTSTKLIDIARHLEVDPEWLLHGETEKTLGRPRDGIPMQDLNAKEISAWDNRTPLGDDEVEIPYYKSIELAAGNGCKGGSDDNGFKLRFSRSTLNRYNVQPSDAMSFPVHGDSMSPVIPDGTTVSVSKGHTKVIDGGIYAIQQDDLLRVKILHRQPGGKLIVRSFNSVDYPDEIADESTVKIIGRVFNWSVMGW